MKTINILEEMKPVDLDPVRAVYEQLKTVEESEKRAFINAGFASSGLGTINDAVVQAKGKVYRISEIKKICIRYDFKLLNPMYYIGSVHPLLASNIAKHAQGRSVYKDRYYLLAPRELFVREVIDPEPILFYDLGDDYYEVVDQWGKDMTSARRIEAIVRLFTQYDMRRTTKHSGAWLFAQSVGFLIAWGLCALVCLIPPLRGGLPYSWIAGFTISNLIFWPCMEYYGRKVYYNRTDFSIKNS